MSFEPENVAGSGPGGPAEQSDAEACSARFSELYEPVAPALFAWASARIPRALRASQSPEDLLQEVACRAWARYSERTGEDEVFRGWIFGIAQNVLHEALRRLARRPSLPQGRTNSATGRGERLASLPDRATTLTRAFVRRESMLRIVARVDALDEGDRLLLVHRGLEGLPHAETAMLLRTTPEAAAKRWQRLRDALGDDSELVALLVE